MSLAVVITHLLQKFQAPSSPFYRFVTGPLPKSCRSFILWMVPAFSARRRAGARVRTPPPPPPPTEIIAARIKYMRTPPRPYESIVMDPEELERQYTPSKWNTRFPEGGIVENHVQVQAEGECLILK